MNIERQNQLLYKYNQQGYLSPVMRIDLAVSAMALDTKRYTNFPSNKKINQVILDLILPDGTGIEF